MTSRIQTLVDLVPLEMLESVLDSFSKATGLKTLITDYRGRPITKTTNFNCFCKKVRVNPQLERKCIRSDAAAGIEAAELGKSVIYRCYAGMVDTATPIIVNDTFLGTLFTGQVLLTDEDMEKVDFLFGPNGNIADDPEIIHFRQEYLRNNAKISLQQLESYVQLLQTIAQYIGELGARNIISKDIAQQREKLLAEQQQREVLKDEMQALERDALLNQLSPMFLYDAFNVIHRQSILENAVNTTALLESLTMLIRRNLNKNHAIVSIQQEVEYIHAFLHLENVSRHYKMELIESIAPESYNIMLPFTSLQHLIECLFVHNAKDQDMEIRLTISLEGADYIRIVLHAPKVQIDTEEHVSGHVSQDQLSSVTVKSIVGFFEQYYKDSFKYSLQSSAEQGALFTMSIPISGKFSSMDRM